MPFTLFAFILIHRPTNNFAKLIMLLVDQNVSNRTITESINITDHTNTSIIIIFFEYQQNNTTIESYVVTDLTSAVKAVMSYYK